MDEKINPRKWLRQNNIVVSEVVKYENGIPALVIRKGNKIEYATDARMQDGEYLDYLKETFSGNGYEISGI